MENHNFKITIHKDEVELYAAIIAGLVREGINFRSTLVGNDLIIEPTGGH